MPRHKRAVQGYVALVAAAAGLLLTWSVDSLRHLSLGDHWPAFVLFASLYLAGELFPIERFSRTDSGVYTTSETFGYALLLSVPLPLAMLAFPLGSVAGDLRKEHRKPLIRTLFNAAQLTLSFGLGGMLLELLLGRSYLHPDQEVGLELLLVLAISGLSMFLLNVVLTSLAIAIDQGAPVVKVLRDDLVAVDVATHMMLVALAPIFAIVTQRSFAIAPLLLGVMAAVHRSTRSALRRQHESLHDSLTGLPNRRMLDARLGELLSGRQRRGDVFGLLLMDLDRFKDVNDTLGHHVGDHLLLAVSERLRSIRGIELVARLGGDEFAMLVPPHADEATVRSIAARVVRQLSLPFVIQGLDLRVGGSVGVALSPIHGNDAPTLLRRADSAMYAAKRGGTGYAVAETSADAKGPGRVSLLSDLQRAIERTELHIALQPKVSPDLRRLHGFEALVRWDHPELGPISPTEFIPMVEHTELVAPLTELVLRQALEAAKRLSQHGIDVPLAVNISSRDLQDRHLPRRIAQLLASADVPASMLTLELTENALLLDHDRATAVLRELEGRGIRTSIDDFGTGYSSLAYLRDLPVHAVKIDRSFIDRIANSDVDVQIVRAITELAAGLKLDVIAEGVESEPQRRVLERLGCSQLQGYIVSRPLSVDDAIAWAQREHGLGSFGVLPIHLARPAVEVAG